MFTKFKRLFSKPNSAVLSVDHDILSALPEGVLALDLNEKIIFINQRARQLLSARLVSDFETILNDIIREADLLKKIRWALSSGIAASYTLVPLTVNNATKFLGVSISPLAGGCVVTFRDMTEVKLRDQIRVDFVANVSHELRTPLAAIKLHADTLASDFDSQQTIEPSFIAAIQRNTDRLIALMQDLLELSALDSGISLSKEPLNTKQLTEGFISGFDSTPPRIERRYEADTVFGDPHRIEQVLSNLVGNAKKYTPKDGRIEITWANSLNGSVQLKVTDTGEGIASEHLPRLFERFYRVDKSRSRQQGGTGLGLAIVKHIMERHGGTVRVESLIGKGSTFICEFPNA